MSQIGYVQLLENSINVPPRRISPGHVRGACGDQENCPRRGRGCALEEGNHRELKEIDRLLNIRQHTPNIQLWNRGTTSMQQYFNRCSEMWIDAILC